MPAYLGTNQDLYRANHIVSLVSEFFKGIFTSYQIGHLKPKVEFYRHIELKLNLRPDQLLLVDDTEENVESAKKCGWNGYFYQGDLHKLKYNMRDYFLI